jgi:membrane protein required for colicin V production
MNWVDVAVVAVILFSGVIGWLRGFIREMLGVAAWALAAYVAFLWYPTAEPLLARYIENPDIANPAAFGALFLIALVVLSVLASVIGRFARDSALGALDGTLGIVFGLVRGAVLMFVVYIGGGMLLPVDRWPPPLQEARTVPYIHQGAVWLAGMVPEKYRPAVAPPPTGRDARAADLLQANPVGSAMARPVKN